MKFEVSPVSSFGLIIFNLEKNLLKKFIKEEKVTKWNFRHTLVPLAAMEVIFLLLQFSWNFINIYKGAFSGNR